MPRYGGVWYETDRELNLAQQLDAAQARLRAIDIENATKEAQQRQAIAEANERQRQAERERLLAEETEAARRASWMRWHTLDGANVEQYAASGFSKEYLAANTPAEGWPPDDGPQNYQWSNAITVERTMVPDDDAPVLIRDLRKAGYNI